MESNEANGINVNRETLAQATQRVLDARRWSLRVAATATGVNSATIKNMKDGREVGASHVLKFAAGSGEDLVYWSGFIGAEVQQYLRDLISQAASAASPMERVRIESGTTVEIIKPGNGPFLYRLDDASTNALLALLDALGRRISNPNLAT
jgi:hypothetical protein